MGSILNCLKTSKFSLELWRLESDCIFLLSRSHKSSNCHSLLAILQLALQHPSNLGLPRRRLRQNIHRLTLHLNCFANYMQLDFLGVLFQLLYEFVVFIQRFFAVM